MISLCGNEECVEGMHFWRGCTVKMWLTQGECERCNGEGETHGRDCIVRRIIFNREDLNPKIRPTKEAALARAISAVEKFIERDKKLRMSSNKIIPFDPIERKSRMSEAVKKEVSTYSPPSELMSNPFSSLANFEAAQRMAKALSESTLIPDAYRKNIPNCLIALEISQRLRASILMVMQNLYIVHGKPGWSAQYIISAINSCGKFSPLRFKFDDVNAPTECQAYAIENKTGETLYGTKITMKMAHDEGWVNKNGSKWKTMPEQMLRYRAASFFGKVYAPEILMGFQTIEEVEDMHGFAAAKEVKSEFVTEPYIGPAYRGPSPSQIARLYTIASAAGITHDHVHKLMKEKYAKESSKDLTIPEYDHMCNLLIQMQEEKEFQEKEEPKPEPQPEAPKPAATGAELPWEKYLDQPDERMVK
jgi:hypothetical protein